VDGAAILRSARFAAQLSQRELGDRAGVAASVISDYERGRRSPTVRQLTRLLAAAGFQVQTELVGLGADTDSLIRRSLALPTDKRLHHLQNALDTFVPLLHGVCFVIEGAAAAVLQGAPIPAPWLGIVVPDEDPTLERLAHAITAAGFVRLWDGGRWRLLPAIPALFRALGPVTRWQVYLDEVRVRIAARSEMAADAHVSVNEVPLPVVGLWRIESTDPGTAKILARTRELAAALSEQ
jgi:transcriptional regulator with XRE-family HTH domain